MLLRRVASTAWVAFFGGQGVVSGQGALKWAASRPQHRRVSLSPNRQRLVTCVRCGWQNTPTATNCSVCRSRIQKAITFKNRRVECPNCLTMNRSTVKRCITCSHELVKQKECHSCGKLNKFGASRCSSCFARLGHTFEPQTKTKCWNCQSVNLSNSTSCWRCRAVVNAPIDQQTTTECFECKASNPTNATKCWVCGSSMSKRRKVAKMQAIREMSYSRMAPSGDGVLEPSTMVTQLSHYLHYTWHFAGPTHFEAVHDALRGQFIKEDSLRMVKSHLHELLALDSTFEIEQVMEVTKDLTPRETTSDTTCESQFLSCIMAVAAEYGLEKICSAAAMKKRENGYQLTENDAKYLKDSVVARLILRNDVFRSLPLPMIQARAERHGPLYFPNEESSRPHEDESLFDDEDE